MGTEVVNKASQFSEGRFSLLILKGICVLFMHVLELPRPFQISFFTLSSHGPESVGTLHFFEEILSISLNLFLYPAGNLSPRPTSK